MWLSASHSEVHEKSPHRFTDGQRETGDEPYYKADILEVTYRNQVVGVWVFSVQGFQLYEFQKFHKKNIMGEMLIKK